MPLLFAILNKVSPDLTVYVPPEEDDVLFELELSDDEFELELSDELLDESETVMLWFT